MSFDASNLVGYSIVSALIALFVVMTRPKTETLTESNTSLFIKVFVISFVCVYFGLMFFSTTRPDINTGEPDF